MPLQTEIYINPQQATDVLYIREALAKSIGSKLEDITEYIIKKKSIDARKRDILIRIVADVYINEPYVNENPFKLNPQPLQKRKRSRCRWCRTSRIICGFAFTRIGHQTYHYRTWQKCA